MTSTYRRWVVLIDAVVPSEIAPTCGSSAPEPSTSHALSPAAAISGSPAGMPVTSAADALIVPSTPPGGTSRGSHAGSTGTACHFQSPGFAQRRAL